MAQPSTETTNIRLEMTKLLDALERVDAINDRYVALGGQEFFAQYLEDEANQPTTDITTAEFVTAIAAVQAMNNWLNTNLPSLIKLRI